MEIRLSNQNSNIIILRLSLDFFDLAPDIGGKRNA
jgi:hypothetical protein